MGLFPAMADVAEFHQTFGHPMQPSPTIPPPERQVLRAKLIREEYIAEFVPAWNKCAELGHVVRSYNSIDGNKAHTSEITDALTELADAMADMIYVINGCALEYGIPLHLVWSEVQRANMDKLWKVHDEEEFEELQKHCTSKGRTYKLFREGNKTDGFLPKQPDLYVLYEANGKVAKPPHWKAPDIRSIIANAMQPTETQKSIKAESKEYDH